MQPTETDPLDAADMERLAAGHDSGLNALMERHGPKLFNYLLRSLENDEDAADLAQETFVRIYQNRAKFNPRLRFTAWMYTIATNLVKDRYRYRTRHPQVSLDAENPVTGTDFRDTVPEDAPLPVECLTAEERAESVRSAVQRLPEELRTPLVLFEYEDLSHAEIADILKCSAKAVETRIYRARQQLRISLRGLMREDPRPLSKASSESLL